MDGHGVSKLTTRRFMVDVTYHLTVVPVVTR